MDQENINRILEQTLGTECDSVLRFVSPDNTNPKSKKRLSEAAIEDIASSLVEIEERLEYKLDMQKVKSLLTKESKQIKEIFHAVIRMRNID